MMKIVHSPSTVLTSTAQQVKTFDASLLTLIEEMKVTLDAQTDPEGVGLAAPQVGVGKALFIMRPDEDKEAEVCINPRILKISILPKKTKVVIKIKKNTPLEGCLSIPRIWAPVKRPKKVLLEYQDITGKKITKWYSGFEAVIVQHEVDHLQGILFTQRALEQQTPLYEEKDGKLEKMDY